MNIKKILTLKKVVTFSLIIFSLIDISLANAQFIHPGMSHKKSDLERIKLMVDSRISPYYDSYLQLAHEPRASFDYEVEGDTSMTNVSRGFFKNQFEADSKAAYFNALQWFITGDERHALKAVEIFNAWVNIQTVSTSALEAGAVYPMLEAAEIIKHTYSGWSDADVGRFEDMLVYPGYSNTIIPSTLSDDNGSFYWRAYMGEPTRSGSQGLSGWRAVMAIGIFLDNEIIYDRAYRYVSGMNHRPDDFAYASGPAVSAQLFDVNKYTEKHRAESLSTIEDYGYDDVITNYIFENGQNADSSKDQSHPSFALGVIASISEMAWNQGDDLWTAADNRILKGLEHYLQYNLSFVKSFVDQQEPWEPTVGNGQFISQFDRSNRSRLLAMNPFNGSDLTTVTRGSEVEAPYYELVYASLIGRGLEDTESAKWIDRSRTHAIERAGFEQSDTGVAYLGFGGMSFRRPEGSFGEPISGFESNGLPEFNMNILPATIQAENYDYSPINGNGRTYKDVDSANRGQSYRQEESVDIQANSDGFHVAFMEPCEWLTYTVYVPATGIYDLSIRYAAVTNNGGIRFEFSGQDSTGEIELSDTGGWEKFTTAMIAEGVFLNQGVQSLKVFVEGSEQAFNLDSFTVSSSADAESGDALSSLNTVDFNIDREQSKSSVVLTN